MLPDMTTPTFGGLTLAQIVAMPADKRDAHIDAFCAGRAIVARGRRIAARDALADAAEARGATLAARAIRAEEV